ncbi:DUF5666 domain-containing protein [Marinobacter zhanjiangensis]|uniref:DUF5666 domain-containing protein n=1 Tax=Marinobacter zhanjiangensis TaxID=578215 RepID=A0ABQ3B5Y2_9GAMM|nr:DUF5666 domain-containing protein [Marinobacter zhanjiangensis]GGY81155.1 hypothetical protein GCM10007071_30660 [Marinobacter zhanjiangensis]
MTGRFLSGVSAISVLLLTMLLASCGGGGGSSVADGGIRGTGSSVGPVSGFSSVIVNGILFKTRNLGVDGFQGEVGIPEPTKEYLKKGMILQIRGEWRDDGEGEAESIRYDDTLRGPVTAVPEPWDGVTGQGRIEVMGFEVTLDRLTQTTLDDLRSIGVDDNRLRVSGWLQEDGSFRASYVGVADAGNSEEIEGYLRVTGDEPNQRYFVGDLEIDILSGAACDELQLSDGTSVDVEGEYFSGAAFTVSRICNGPASFLDASLDEDVQVAGVVTSEFTGDRNDGRFTLNGIPVTTNDDTDFDDIEPADISGGVLLQVEGRYINDNDVLTLRAEEIEYRDADAEVEGAPEMSLNDILRVGGVEIRLTAFTIREDDDDEDDRCPANLGDAANLEVAGIQRSADGGYLEALEVECDNEAEDAGFELEGRITALNPQQRTQSLTALGVTILVNESTVFDDIDFDSLSKGDKVEVEYVRLLNGDFLATDIEREDD